MPHVGQVAQEESGAPEGDRDPRRAVAKLDFELGLSLRTIGAKVGVSGQTISVWAKEEGWKKGGGEVGTRVARVADQNLPALVAANGGEGRAADVVDVEPRVNPVEGDSVNRQPDSVNPEHNIPLDQKFRDRVQQLLQNPSPDEAVDVAARAVVQVVSQHRRGLVKAQNLCDSLLDQLHVASSCRDLLEDFITETTEPGKYRSMLMRLVSLSAHAGTMRDLSTAMSKLVALERQAFGLGQQDDPTPPPPPEALPNASADVFTTIREKARARLEAMDVEAKK